MESEPHMQLDLYNRMPVLIEGTSSQLLSESHIRNTFFQPSNLNDTMTGLPLGQPFQDLHSDRFLNFDGLSNRDYLNHQQLCLVGNRPNCVSNNLITQEEVASESLRATFASSSSIPSSLSCEYDSLISGANNKWDQNRLLMHPELDWRTSTSDIELQGANEWGLTRSAYGTLRSQNELCLSLATTNPSFPCPDTIQQQCSEMGYSGIFDHSQSQRRLCAERSSSQRSLCSKELSLGRASSSQSAEGSELISGSRYRAVLQQILSEVASYSLDGVDHTNFSVGNSLASSSNIPFSSDQFGTDEPFDDGGSVEAPAGSSRRKQKLESKKSQLLSLLQVVDDQYTRCLDQIHTVISAFHAASDLDPQLHACFALQSVSFFYKSLRQRITDQILEMGMNSEVGRDGRKSFEETFIQKQWALQQIKKKDQQLWRPQRGLPEKSVSVLRAWMFDNFLHPYPKDAEKHLLAIKSGLSRSQVSNWFINARVRLWKPLVEEMCSELNRKKGSRQSEEGSNDNNNRSSQVSNYDFNRRFNA